MQPDFPTPRIAAAVQQLAEALDVPPDLLGPVITPPDQLDDLKLIPYESTDRTPAGPLQQLEAAAAAAYGIERSRLVSRDGTVTDDGAACLFQLAANPGDPVGDRWIITAQRGPLGRLRMRQRQHEADARAEYATAVEWLAP